MADAGYTDRASQRVRISRGRNKYVYRARAVMEAHLGRALRSDEHVHHVNGDPSDDRIENLRVLDRREHGRLHGKHTLLDGAWALEHDGCAECGTTERAHVAYGLCSRCYNRQAQRVYRARRAA